MTLPTLTVLLDDGTGSFPYDISKYVMFDEGYSFNRGRADWQGGVTAGQLSLTLNNSDGRFTPGSTLIASPSPIKVDQRIRIRVKVNGTTFTRFTGYVKSWPVEWPATVTTISMSPILATDAQARAERYVARTFATEEILNANPDGYWPLSDPATATKAVDFGSGQQAAIQGGTGTAVVFGTTSAPGTEETTAATFAGGRYLHLESPAAPAITCVAFSFATTSTMVSLFDIDPASADLYIDASGALRLGTGFTIAAGPFNDGLGHGVAVSFNAGTGATNVYVDGSFAGSGVVSAGALGAVDMGLTLSGVVGLGNFVGTMANLAVWNTAPSSTLLAAISGTGKASPFSGETTDARVSRLARYAGIPLGTLDVGLTSVPGQDLLGQSDWDALERSVEAEQGSAFINATGALDFHNRNRVASKTTPDLTLAAIKYVSPDVSPIVDDQQIVNYFEATSDTTGLVQVSRSVSSETAHGRYSDSKSYLVLTDAEALDRANWIVANFAEPSPRYGTLTLNLFKMSESEAAAVFAVLDLDMWLRVTLLAPQNTGGATVDVVVEGFTESCAVDSWTVTLNVVSRSLFNAWILGDPTYGVLDSTTRLYV